MHRLLASHFHPSPFSLCRRVLNKARSHRPNPFDLPPPRSTFAMVAAPLIPEWDYITTGPKPYYMFTMPIHKSRQDDREYRIIQLDNGLQIMLVHDAKADKAAASLDVSVGHLYDPVSRLTRCCGAHADVVRMSMTYHHSRTICQVLPTSANTCCSWYAAHNPSPVVWIMQLLPTGHRTVS